MSKLNIMIECIEKNNTIENSVNIAVGAYINASQYLQWVPNKLVFVVCRSSISYRATRWTDGQLLVYQIESYLSSSFPLNKYICGSFLLILSL